MNAKGISLACCVAVAVALGACSGDSQPTGPGAEGAMLHSPALYNDPYGDAPAPEDPASPGSGTSTSDTPTYGSAADGSDAPPPPPPPSGGDPGGGSSGSITTHPIDKFLSTQGTFCADDGMGGCAYYMAPTANYLAWFDRARPLVAAVDYAGIVDRFVAARRGTGYGTTINGTVVEEVLADGTTRITIDANGQNVSAYIVQGFDFSGSSYWGTRPAPAFETKAEPALGTLQMRIVFINDKPGEPLPDLMQLVRAPRGAQRLESFWMSYEGLGRMSGAEYRRYRILYDGSMGAIEPSHPASPSTTPAMGGAIIAEVAE